MSNRLVAWVGVLALAAVGAVAPSAFAAKPPSGGGGTGGGTIRFAYSGATWSMSSDGSGKSALPAGVGGQPGYMLHGGHRWFLDWRQVSGTNPDGTSHVELFAVRGDGGTTVQLTNDAAVQPAWSRWGKDDSFFSFSAVDWSVPAAPVSRLARIDLAYDVSGTPSVTGSPAYVVTIAAVQPPVNGQVLGVLTSHDWSPSAAQVAWTDRSTNPAVLKVTTLLGGSTATLATGGDPAWSPDGSRIAFHYDGVMLVAPNGSGLQRVLRNGPRFTVFRPEWSPTGSHLVYLRDDWSVFPRQLDIFRSTASGSSPTNLTPDISSAGPIAGWR